MKIAIAQLNPTVGDLDGNLALLREAVRELGSEGAELLVCSELFLTGYPPRDLLERDSFLREAEAALGELAAFSRDYPSLGILVGTVTRAHEQADRRLHNTAALVENGQVLFQQHKTLLPVYDVFDERRYFEPAATVRVFPYKGERLGISICEDAWNDPEITGYPAYPTDPLAILASQRPTIMLNLSASPFHLGKDALRRQLIGRHAAHYRLPFILVNQVGGNDELIFDGHSLLVSAAGTRFRELPGFATDLTTIDTRQLEPAGATPAPPRPTPELEQVRQALVLGIRDYFRKCGFRQALVGLSGGIDSALVCCLAVDALGAENVWGIGMPSPFSSPGSIDDAQQLAANLGIKFDLIPIASLYQQFLQVLAPTFAGRAADVTEENIQARIRGVLLMALSNKFGHLLLTTGNKSELAVGYCTLYGDMCGGLGVISDLPKTMVYRLADHLNRDRELIPRAIITKAPSAELRPEQKDQDTLPPYEILDQVLEQIIDEGKAAAEIIAAGFPPETVEWIARAVKNNEYKRRQAAPGLKITSKAFGSGRRMPIAARYRV